MNTLILDCETRGLIPELGQTTFAVGACDPDLPTCKVTLYFLQDRNDVELLLQRIQAADVIVGHNVKFDIRQLIRTLGLPLDYFHSKKIVDTLIYAKHLIPQQVNTGGYGLKVLTARMTAGLFPHADPKKWLRKKYPIPRKTKGATDEEREAARKNRTDFSLLPDEVLVPYLSNDIIRTYALYRQCRTLLATASNATKANIEVEENLILPVLGMELKGVPISMTNLIQAKTTMQEQLRDLKNVLPFDFLSRTALVEYFGDLLRKFGFFTETYDSGGRPNVSADKDALQYLQSRDVAWAEEVLLARSYHKMLTTYFRNWERFGDLGRIHCSFNIVGPRTGRMSADNPNLQNIPKKIMRRVIVPEEGKWLLLGDYSQMELRAAAIMSKDVALAEALKDDVHTATARYIFKTDSPSKEERKAAKVVRFAVLYGAMPKRIRRSLNMETGKVWDMKTCQEIYERLWEMTPQFATWSKSIERFARNHMPLTDPLGRRQFSHPLHSYAMVNYLIQGFCAGIFKRALLASIQAGLDVRLPVHDEIGVMIAPEMLKESGALLKSCMENVSGFYFPVDLSVCRTNWEVKESLKEALA